MVVSTSNSCEVSLEGVALPDVGQGWRRGNFGKGIKRASARRKTLKAPKTSMFVKRTSTIVCHDMAWKAPA